MEETVFKNPVMERDEKIFQLGKEKLELATEIPELREKMKKYSK